MLKQEQVSSKQFSILVFFFVIGNTFIDQPGELALKSGRDLWVSIIVGTLLALTVIWFWMGLQKKIGDRNLIEANEYFFGKAVGKVISFCFFLFFMMNFLYSSFIFVDFCNLNILPGMDRLILGVLYAIVVVFMVRQGLQNIARVSELIFPVCFLLLITFFVFLLQDADFHFLQPILTNGVGPTIKGVTEVLSSPFFELVTLMVIFSTVGGNKWKTRSFYIGTILGGGVLLVLNILAVAVMGLTQVQETVYSTFTLAKVVHMGEYLDRVESIVSLPWMMSQVIYGALSFYAACYTFAKVFNLDAYRYLTYPLILISLAYSPFLIPNRMIFNLNFWFPYSFFFAIFFPVLLWFVAFVKTYYKRRIVS